MSKGYFKKEKYSGWYSVTDECFLSQNSKVQLDSSQLLEWYEEDNWIFHIQKFKPEIQKWIDSGTIYPENVLPAVKEYFNETNFVSVSRPSHRIKWGIPVPDDPDQTIYVWFEALINYLTVSQTNDYNIWPLDMQVIGKDILRFHTVLWPAILLGLGLELPKKIFIHSHWLQKGVKMSKSLGNVVDPHKEAEILGDYELLKYFLLSENAVVNDSVYDTNRAIERINNHLVNITGNLLSRISGSKINPHKKLGVNMEISDTYFSGIEFKKLLDELRNLRSVFEKHMDDLNIHFAIESVISVLKQTNVFFDSQAPWKSFEDERCREAIIYVSSESLRMAGILLQCFVPKLAGKMLDRLSVPVEQRTLAEVHFNRDAENNSRLIHDFHDEQILMRRITKQKT